MKCKSCGGKKKFEHSAGAGYSGGRVIWHVDCTVCEGTGIHNQEKYIASQKEMLNVFIENLTYAVERDMQKLKKDVAALKSLKAGLAKHKKELAALEKQERISIVRKRVRPKNDK